MTSQVHKLVILLWRNQRIPHLEPDNTGHPACRVLSSPSPSGFRLNQNAADPCQMWRKKKEMHCVNFQYLTWYVISRCSVTGIWFSTPKYLPKKNWMLSLRLNSKVMYIEECEMGGWSWIKIIGWIQPNNASLLAAIINPYIY